MEKKTAAVLLSMGEVFGVFCTQATPPVCDVTTGVFKQQVVEMLRLTSEMLQYLLHLNSASKSRVKWRRLCDEVETKPTWLSWCYTILCVTAGGAVARTLSYFFR